MDNWKFYIETFGCKVNQYESQAIRESWQRAGGQETDDPGQADFILVNSCAITARAERNARNAVFRLKKNSAPIILTGCAAQFYDAFTPRKNANFAMPDFCVPQAAKTQLLAGPQALVTDAGSGGYEFAINFSQRSRPIIKIQDGCSQNCAYCIVPQTRGKPRGRDAAAILAECRRLAALGYGELMLSGVNLAQYPGGFWQLLAWLDKELASDYAGKLRLRISSVDPSMLNEKGLACLASCRLVCPHLHLSLQHASENVLLRMGRRHYSRAAIRKAITGLGRHWPAFGLGADILVGFPGENKADLQILLDFIEEIPLTYAHVFPYSRRQGTPAKEYPGQIPKSEKENRARLVRDAVHNKGLAFLQKQLAMPQMRIAPEALRDGQNRGVNEFYTVCLLAGPMPASRGLIDVKPVKLADNGLLVECVDAGDKASQKQ